MNTILFILLIIISVDYLIELLLDSLNLQHRTQPIPDILADVYDADSYAHQQKYEAVRTKFSLFQGLTSFILIVIAFYFGLFGWLHEYLLGLKLSSIGITLAFFGILLLVSQLFSLPFALWSTFVIEEKYGFNRVTPKLFFIDSFKSLILTVIIGGGLLALITFLFHLTGQWFWLMALGVFLSFSLLANALYSVVIVPLFNKQTPLEQGELHDSIVALAEKVGFPISKVFIIDGSKRSSKANAYFAGFGSNRRVVLYDTLLNSLDNDEIVAVLAHEIGHFKRKHLWKNFCLGAVQMALMLYFFNLLAHSSSISVALGFSGATEPVFHLNLIAFGFLFSPIQHILGIGMNLISRRMEYQADDYATKQGFGNGLVIALKKLSKANYSNLTPHPTYVFVNYSHPTLLQRVRNILRK